MSSHPIQVFSEIGKLKKVMLHRPGKELENLLPDYLERLLFDDIPFLEMLKKNMMHLPKLFAMKELRFST